MSHIHGHAFDLTEADAELQGLDTRKSFNGQILFIRIALIINVFADTANTVSAHFGFTSVCVEDTHFEIRDGGRRYVDHSVRAGTEMPLGKLC